MEPTKVLVTRFVKGAIFSLHETMGRLAAKILNRLGLGVLCFFSDSSYLSVTGWLHSLKSGESLLSNGDPSIWVTYPSRSFLAARVKPEMVIFEYGCGNSTLWWAKRVKRVYSCEHNRVWYDKIKAKIPLNVDLCLRGLDSGYADRISEFKNIFDVVVIDGRDRVKCAYNVVEVLKPDGVVIWDNSERDRYAQGLEYMQSLGFKRIDFDGLGALAVTPFRTSILYRQNNCLGI